MTDDAPRARSAFAAEAAGVRALSAAKAAWWGAGAWALRRLGWGPSHGASFTPSHAPPPPGYLRERWREAFAKDAADVAAGLYPSTEQGPADTVRAVRRMADLIADAQSVSARRRREGRAEVREEGDFSAYPPYYRQNFHYQSGGWFTADSARRYEAQVEALFTGAAGPMRRRALSLLARAWLEHDTRGLKLLDLACGSGSFLADLARAFPRAAVMGLDLSGPYLTEARARSGAPGVQAAAERLPFADASLDAITCVFLFHELPPKVRPAAAAEIARVLKPGGLFAFADSVQAADEPELARLLEAFPAFFHEPYYASYQETDFDVLFGAVGLLRVDADKAFLTKAVLYRKG